MTYEITQLHRDAIAYLEQLRGERKDYADLLRAGRADVKQMCIETNKPHRFFLPSWRRVMRAQAKFTFGGGVPVKPTRENILMGIKNLEERTSQPLQAIILDDGYACCGQEDFAAERRENDLAELEIFKAVLTLV